MKIKKNLLAGSLGTVLTVCAIAAVMYVIMLLWNWVIPDITGWKEIKYWQVWVIFFIIQLFNADYSLSMKGDSDINDDKDDDEEVNDKDYTVKKIGNLEIKIRKDISASND